MPLVFDVTDRQDRRRDYTYSQHSFHTTFIWVTFFLSSSSKSSGSEHTPYAHILHGYGLHLALANPSSQRFFKAAKAEMTWSNRQCTKCCDNHPVLIFAVVIQTMLEQEQ